MVTWGLPIGHTLVVGDTPAFSSDLKVDNVLVPLDGSALALRAVATGLQLADRFGAQLHTISVAKDREESERLRSLVPASLRHLPGDKSVRIVIGDDPADAIVGRAGELESCVVCITSNGRGRLDGAIMGSVARSVMQQSNAPTVALGPSADNPGWSPPPRSWPKPLSVPRMIACVDGTEESEQVLPVATAWAGKLGMSLTILTVVDDSAESTPRDEGTSSDGPLSEPATYVASLVERWSDVLSDIDGEVVRDPISPASGVRNHLSRRPAGLVALTTHGRSGMQRVRFGAQAANIVRASVVPCLVTPVG